MWVAISHWKIQVLDHLAVQHLDNWPCINMTLEIVMTLKVKVDALAFGLYLNQQKSKLKMALNFS